MSRSYVFPELVRPHDFSRYIARFTGQGLLFEKIDQWLQEQDGRQFYLLTGEPGVGKSAIDPYQRC